MNSRPTREHFHLNPGELPSFNEPGPQGFHRDVLNFGLNNYREPSSYKDNGIARMPQKKNERVELEMKIMKYRLLARDAPDEVTRQRINGLVTELEQRQREIDE